MKKNKYKVMLSGLLLMFACLQGFSQGVSDSDYAYNQGAEAFKEYKFEDAISWFEQSIKNKQHLALSYVFKAGAEILMGRIDDGKTNLDNAFRIDSTISNAYFYRARQLMAMNKYDSAIWFLKTAIKLEPAAYGFYDNLAKAFLAKGQTDSARLYENEAIRLSHNGPMFINNLATIEFETGDYELALLHHQTALNLSFKVTRQKDPAILIGIAACEWKLKKYQDALSRCDEILQKYSDYSRAYKLRALINYELGKKDKACADFVALSHIKGTEKEGLDNLKTHGCPIEDQPFQK